MQEVRASVQGLIQALPLYAPQARRDALQAHLADPIHALALAWLTREIDPGDALALAHQALAAAEAPTAALRARAVLIEAWYTVAVDVLAKARPLAEQALVLFAAVDDAIGIADTWTLIGWLDNEIGEIDAAFQANEHVLAAATRAGDVQRQDFARIRQAIMLMMSGRDLQAWPQLALSAPLDEVDPAVRAQWLFLDMSVRVGIGRHEGLQQACAEAIEALLPLGMHRSALLSAANCALGQNGAQQFDLAIGWVERALELARRSWPQREGQCLVDLAATLDRAGHYAQARQVLQRSIELQEHYPNPRTRILTTVGMADIDLHEHQPAQALVRLDQCLCEPGLWFQLRRHVQFGRCRALVALDRNAEVLEIAEALIAEDQADGVTGERFEAGVLRATALLALGRASEAREAAAALLELADASTEFVAPYELLITLSRASAACGDHEQASRMAWRADELRGRNFSELTGQRAQVAFAHHQIERSRLEAEHLRAMTQATHERLQALERVHEVAGHLAEIGRDLTARLDLAESLQTIERHVTRMLGASGVAVYLGEAGEALECAHAGGDAPRLSSRHSALALCARERRLVLDTEAPTGRERLWAPLLARGRMLGAVAVEATRAFEEDQGAILTSLCAYAGIALDNASAYRDLASAQARLRAQERIAAMGVLVAGIAHQLNTPVGNVRLVSTTLGQASGVVREAVAGGTLRRTQLVEFLGECDVAIDVIERSSLRLIDLVGDFKQVAQERGTQASGPLDLASALAQAALGWREAFARAGHRIEVSAADSIEIESLAQPLAQALDIGLANALQHGLAGRRDGCVRLSAEANERGARVRIEDDGCGMSRAVLARAPEPFFTTQMGTHTGLGLTILHNIVTDMLGGELGLHSAPGRGTCLTLDLPRRPAD